jgi:hypothetical protein
VAHPLLTQVVVVVAEALHLASQQAWAVQVVAVMAVTMLLALTAGLTWVVEEAVRVEIALLV